MKKLFAAVLIFMIITFGVFFDFKTKSPLPLNIPKTETLIVPIHSLKTQSFTYTKSFIGSVEAIQSVAIVPYLSGFLKEVHVNSGSKVNQGDILFLLDERIPSAELEQAKETVVQAFSARANAENYYNRIKNTESKAISATELEQARTTFEGADATYQKALGAQKQAQTLYDYTVIKAPISGWVGNITATVGEYLSPQGKILANLIGFSPIRLIFSIPMSAYQDNIDLKKARLKVILENGQTLEFKNFQVIQDNQTNKTTDSLSFFIDVPNEDRFLMPDAYVEIQFVFSESGVLVNKNWITLTPDGAEAMVLNQGIIEKRSVQLAEPIGNQYWIKSGISEGENIITVPISANQIGQSAKGVFK